MNIKETEVKIIELEARLNITFPQLYFDFLVGIKDGDVFEVKNSGMCIYSYSDLEERNQTYQIKENEPNYFKIGQGGELGNFIKTDTPKDNSIFSNDLGALGSLEMKKEADNIFDLIK